MAEKQFIIKDIPVTCDGDEDYTAEELAQYVRRGHEFYHDRLKGINIKFDGEFCDIQYELTAQPFNRIRRITGYLVGDLSRFNNGKHAEVRDRVKHTTK